MNNVTICKSTVNSYNEQAGIAGFGLLTKGGVNLFLRNDKAIFHHWI